MIKKMFNVWMIAMLMIPVCWAAENKSVDQEKLKNREEKIKEFFKEQDAPIDFYGKITDQNGEPVEDAQVTLHIAHFDPTIFYGDSGFVGFKNVVVKTNKKGFFAVVGEKGSGVYIDAIDKKGYEWLATSVLYVEEMKRKGHSDESISNLINKSYYYSPGAQKKHHADKTNPVIFTMRKKEPATLVFKHGFSFRLNLNGVEQEIDLITKGWGKSGVLGTRSWDKDAHADIRIKAELSNDQTNYAVTFTTPDDKSGIVEEDALLYEAPEEGYQPSKTITFPMEGNIKKHLYVKSRQGNVYARLDIEIRAHKEGIGLYITSYANPNGLRNVDYDEEQEIEYTRRKNEEDKRKIMEREERKKLKQQQNK